MKLKVANVVKTVYHVYNALGKSDLMLSLDFITIKHVIFFKFRCLWKNVSRSKHVRTYYPANNNRTISDIACLDQ